MQVIVTHVKPSVLRPGQTEHPVQVCLVIDAKPPGLVDDIHKLADAVIVNTRILRVGNHKRRRPLRHRRLKRLDIRQAVLVRVQCDHLVTQCRRRTRVRRMG